MAVELKVNVINQLKLLRQSTFKDIYCFLDEDVQNAQRAKATEVRVTVDRWGEGTVTIENNGNILTNPQALFSIAESDWDEEVRNSENPFGMGFFSNITVSNLINVHSGNTYITFDVEDMISTNNTEIKVEEIEEKQIVKNNKKKLEDLNSRLDRLNDLYIDGRITKEKYDKEYLDIQSKIKEHKKDNNINKTRDLYKNKKILNNNNILDLYSKLTPENKRKFWFEYIDYIMQDEEKDFVIFFK